MEDYKVSLKVSIGEKTHIWNCLKDLECTSMSKGIKEVLRNIFGYTMDRDAVVVFNWAELPEVAVKADYDENLNASSIICIMLEKNELRHWQDLAKKECFRGVPSWLLYHLRKVSKYAKSE